MMRMPISTGPSPAISRPLPTPVARLVPHAPPGSEGAVFRQNVAGVWRDPRHRAFNQHLRLYVDLADAVDVAVAELAPLLRSPEPSQHADSIRKVQSDLRAYLDFEEKIRPSTMHPQFGAFWATICSSWRQCGATTGMLDMLDMQRTSIHYDRFAAGIAQLMDNSLQPKIHRGITFRAGQARHELGWRILDELINRGLRFDARDSGYFLYADQAPQPARGGETALRMAWPLATSELDPILAGYLAYLNWEMTLTPHAAVAA
jgi:hypothetical protein